METPILFSVIIPTYNRETLISKAITSLLKQTYKHFECIVVDDGSTDNTEELVLAFKDERIKYFKNKNYGRSYTRNFGFSKSKGSYINFLDSDDELLPNHLELAESYSRKNNSLVHYQFGKILKPNGELVSEEKSIDFQNIQQDFLKVGNLFMMCGVFIKREVFEKEQFYMDRRLTIGEDYEYWLRIVFKYTVKVNPVLSYIVYDHSGRSVRDGDTEQLILSSKILLNRIQYGNIHASAVKANFKSIQSNSYSYIALHLALAKHKLLSIKYLLKAVLASPLLLIRRRFYSTLKHLMV